VAALQSGAAATGATTSELCVGAFTCKLEFVLDRLFSSPSQLEKSHILWHYFELYLGVLRGARKV
jgi:hypothetical protein